MVAPNKLEPDDFFTDQELEEKKKEIEEEVAEEIIDSIFTKEYQHVKDLFIKSIIKNKPNNFIDLLHHDFIVELEEKAIEELEHGT